MKRSKLLQQSIALSLVFALIISFFPAVPASAADLQTVSIDPAGADTNPANTFKGYGLVTANNTSRLMLDYKEEHPAQYWEMMNLLFNQDTGAGINDIKIEMGNDSNTSSGTEPATKRSADEPANVRRGAGFVLAADAKTINPDIKVSILRWSQPNWVLPWSDGNTDPSNPATLAAYERMYQWYKDTATAVHETYGYDLDYINPDRNETGTPNANYIKWFANRMRSDNEFPNHDKIKIIASDENTTLNIPTKMLADPDLMKAVDVMAYHYNMATSADYLKVNDQYQKEVWYSEGVAPQTLAQYRANSDQPFGGVASALDVAGRFIGMYTQGKRTHYMFQPAIGAFYSGAPYSSKELIAARDPWSGYYAPDVGVYTVMQFTQFAAKDWMYIPGASAGVIGSRGNSEMDGNAAGAEYNRLVFVSPDKKDYSVVMVNDSDREARYQFEVKKTIANAGSPVQVWETRGPGAGQEYDANWYQRLGDIPAADQGDAYTYTLTVKPHSMVSVTSAGDNPNTGHPRVPYTRNADIPAQSVLDVGGTGSPVLYEDDFEYKGYPEANGLSYVQRRGGTPRYTADQGGAFEVYEGIGKDGSNGMEQMIYAGNKPGTWATTPFSYTVLGDERWANYRAAIDFKMDLDPAHTGDNYVALGIRHTLNGTTADSQSGYKLRIYADGSWRLIRFDATVASGTLTDFDPAQWHRISIEAADRTVTAAIDGKAAVRYTDTADGAPLTGQVMIQSSLRQSVFDNLQVEAVNGYAPYVTDRVDDLDARVQYHEGSFPWTHSLSGGAGRQNRTVTTSGTSITSDSTTNTEGTLNRWYFVKNEGNTSSWGSNSANAWAGENGSYASLTFNGTGITVYGLGQGTNSVVRMDVYLDDFGTGYNHDASKKVVTGKGFGNGNNSQIIYQVSGLAPGLHNVKIIKTAADSGSGNYISIEKAVVQADAADPTYLELPFTGTGFSLVGDTGSATVDIYVDNKLADANAAIPAVSVNRANTYAYGGLPYGPHTLKIVVKSGSLSIDAIDIMGPVYGTISKSALQELLAQVGGYQEEDYMPAEWSAFANAVSAAAAVLADEQADQRAIDSARNALQDAADSLKWKKQPVAVTGDYPAIVAVKAGEAVAGLPSVVKTTLADGTTNADAAIRWLNNTADRFTVPYSTVQLTGEVEGGKNLYVQVQVEVIPGGLVYFLDPGIAGDTTPPFAAIQALLGDRLLNDKADQASSGDSMWGHTTIAANYKLKSLSGSVVATDKSQTGVYGSDTRNNPLTYALPLTAGDYRITSFHRDWWSNGNRTMDISLSYKDANGQTVTEPVRSGLIAGSDGTAVTHDFTLPVDSVVTYTVNNTYTGNQAALISYLGVEKRVDSAAEQAVADAKTIIEGAAYHVDRTAANTEADVRAWLQQTISSLSGLQQTGASVGELKLTSFRAATENTDGSFEFTVPLTKGNVTGAAVSVGIIKAVDTTKPVITLKGEPVVNLLIGTSYTDAGATATDDRDGDITDRIVTTVTSGVYGESRLNTAVAGTYTFHYNVKDSAGNAAEEVTRTVVVSENPDTTKPVITLKGEPVVNLLIGASYTDAGATATDDRDGDITDRIVTTVTSGVYGESRLNTAAAGVYTFHYNVQDSAGNAAKEVTRIVIVSEQPDTTGPVIKLRGEPVVNLLIGASYTDAGATATDDRDGDITDRIVTTVTSGVYGESALNTAIAGTYTYHYNVQDAAGNAAEEVTRTVIVSKKRQSSSSGSSSSSPSVPEAPTTDETSTTQIVREADLKPAEAGTNVVQIPGGKTAVLLPSHIAELVGDNGLRLVMGNLTIEWTKAELSRIQDVAAGANAEGAQIRFSARTLSQADVTKLIHNRAVNGSVEAALASEAYDFSVDVIAADGSSIPVTSFAEPLTLTFKVDPKADSDLLGVYNIAANGALQFAGGTLSDGAMTAKVRHFSQYAVLEYNKLFADVDASSWANRVIKNMAAKHIIDGVTDTEFNPEGSVTRAQFAAMIARALGLEASKAASRTSFADVDSAGWYAEAVAAVSEAGIVTGRGEDIFAPNAVITREEMAVMAVRAFEYAKGEASSQAAANPFGDQDQISDWAREAAGIAQAEGLIQGRDNRQFAPQAMMTRAESAQVIFNLLYRLK
ncbi:DUF5011 domain-containing protein [Paenibacillus doosanensis]|uniref:immunoglobulin-like domain-containing protein n=1 Tax=Paenibacillus doosanensis TaxID=1229154 RepID=UPI00217FE67B|nr:immunoglobulin-like domain-containing protein [Paenibacillus doosanensis]MCS7463763.1 DUF5011 domain-containing protein [Paenibacillus doosanensis]